MPRGAEMPDVAQLSELGILACIGNWELAGCGSIHPGLVLVLLYLQYCDLQPAKISLVSALPTSIINACRGVLKGQVSIEADWPIQMHIPVH